MANNNSDFSKLDKQIELVLKKNLDSFSPSDDLISRTLLMLEKEKTNEGAKVTAIPKKKKRKVPIALISSIAAGAIVVSGVVALLGTGLLGRSKDATNTAPATHNAAVPDFAVNKAEEIDGIYLTENNAEEIVSVEKTTIYVSDESISVINHEGSYSLVDMFTSGDKAITAFDYLTAYAMDSYSILFFNIPMNGAYHPMKCVLYSTASDRFFSNAAVNNTLVLDQITGDSALSHKPSEKLSKMLPGHELLENN